jgi:hypothetical protein
VPLLRVYGVMAGVCGEIAVSKREMRGGKGGLLRERARKKESVRASFHSICKVYSCMCINIIKNIYSWSGRGMINKPICVCKHTHYMYICICVYMSLFIHVYACIYAHTYIDVCMYACTYVCVCLFLYT